MEKLKLKEEGNDFYGVIAEEETEDVYRLGGEILNLPKAKHTYLDLQTQYNQNNGGRSSCTLYGSMGSVSDLTGRMWSGKEQKSVYAQAVTAGLKPEIGWYINRAVDLIRKNYFRIWNQELLSFNVGIGSDAFFDALDKGYTVVMGYSGNKEYNIDFKDGVLDETSFGVGTYGHCVRMTKSDTDLYEMIVDNYLGQRINTYKIKRNNLDELVKNRVFFRTGYIFVLKEDFEKVNKMSDFFSKVPLWGLVAVEEAIKEGIITLDSDLEEIVATKTVEDYFLKTGIFTKSLGNVSLLRWIIALYRLKNK